MSVALVSQVVATKRGEGRVVHFYADEIEVKAQGEGMDVFEITTNAGCEPPLHVHEREDESFYVLDGEVTFYVGDAVVRGEAGTYLLAPRGIAHTYVVDSGIARMVVTATPSGFIEMFGAVQEAFGGAMPETPAPEHGALLGATLAQFGISIVGPNPSVA